MASINCKASKKSAKTSKTIKKTGTFLLLLLTISSFGLLENCKAQDAVFSQYYASALYLNPAFAGLQSDISLSTNYRVQWNSISPYQTGQVSIIYPFLNKKSTSHEHWGGTGMSIFQDKAGNNGGFQVMGANLNVAYNLPLSLEKHHIISFGLQGGFIQQKIDPANYEWGTKYTTGNNGIDPGVADQSSVLNSIKIYPDLSAGMIWYLNNAKEEAGKKFSSYAGISMYHINSPDQSLIVGRLIHLPRLLKIHGGIKFYFTQKVGISPAFIVAVQNNQYQYNPGIYFSYRLIEQATGLLASTDFIIGSWYRVKDAFIFSTGIASKYITMGFSYDLNNSGLRTYTKGKGAYEVSLSFRIPRSLKLLRFDTPRI